MGNTLESLGVNIREYFFRSNNVKIETVTITLTPLNNRRLGPRPTSTFDETGGLNPAPLHGGREPTVNILAAHLAVDEKERNSNLGEDFSDIFVQHHEACVQVVSTNASNGTTMTGSGVLCKISEKRLILLTAAHVIQEKIEQLVIETNYDKKTDKIHADKITIDLNSEDIEVKKAADVALLFLSDTDSLTVISTFENFSSFPCSSHALASDTDSSTVGSNVSRFPRLSLALPSDTFMAIHYANGEHKQVTAGGILDAGHHKLIKLQLHIDGGPGASGAPLFNVEGDVVGIETTRDNISPEIRNFTPIEEIRWDNSIYECDELQMSTVDKNEGSESKKLLKETCTAKRMSQRSTKAIVGYLENESKKKLHEIFNITLCCGKGGTYKNSKEWSLANYVESDHFPPCDAYLKAKGKKNCPKAILDFFKNYPRSYRLELPAITIPRVIHRKLDTTTNSAFRSARAKDIASGNFKKAIKKNFKNYRDKGLFRKSNYKCRDGANVRPREFETKFKELLNKYFEGFKEALKLHKQLGFICESERSELVNYIETLISEGKEWGEELEDDKRIIITGQ